MSHFPSSYNGTDGSSRWEKVNYESVGDNSKEPVVVPEAVGGYDYTYGGVNIQQIYNSSRHGNSYQTIWTNTPKKGQ